jgi:hypothetical protein
MSTKVTIRLEALDGNTLSLISQLPATDFGRALLAVIESRKDAETSEVWDHPKVDNEDLRRDFRYKLGIIKALVWVLSLPDVSHDLLRAQGGGRSTAKGG